MTIFLESSVPAIAIGAILLAIFAVVLVQTGRRWPLAAMGAVVVLMVGMLLLEKLVVTDREEVANTLFAVESAVANNDVNGVVGFISPSQGQAMAQSIRSRMPMFSIHSARVGRDLKIEMNYLTPAPTAVATFTGSIQVSDKGGLISEANYVRKFTVKLRREGDRWMLYEYEERNPIGPGSRG